MPGYTKIGMTRHHPEKRLAALFVTSVPLPFKLEWAKEVDDRRAAESFLHECFDDKRVVHIDPKTGKKTSREFFLLEPDVAVDLARKRLGNTLRFGSYRAKRQIGKARWRKVKAWLIAIVVVAALWYFDGVDYLWQVANRYF